MTAEALHTRMFIINIDQLWVRTLVVGISLAVIGVASAEWWDVKKKGRPQVVSRWVSSISVIIPSLVASYVLSAAAAAAAVSPAVSTRLVRVCFRFVTYDVFLSLAGHLLNVYFAIPDAI